MCVRALVNSKAMAARLLTTPTMLDRLWASCEIKTGTLVLEVRHLCVGPTVPSQIKRTHVENPQTMMAGQNIHGSNGAAKLRQARTELGCSTAGGGGEAGCGGRRRQPECPLVLVVIIHTLNDISVTSSDATTIHSCGGPQCGCCPHKVRYPQRHSSPIHTALCLVSFSLTTPKVHTSCNDGHDKRASQTSTVYEEWVYIIRLAHRFLMV